MFVFTGHRGPDGCRRSKNKSSTDFWSFVWRISPQHFWHISTFACFCFTELAAQLSSSRPHQPKTQESCLLSSNHSFGWGGVISAYSDFSFSIETLGRFPEKEQIVIDSQIIIVHLLSILGSRVPISQPSISWFLYLRILNSGSGFPMETVGRSQIAKSRLTGPREI